MSVLSEVEKEKVAVWSSLMKHLISPVSSFLIPTPDFFFPVVIKVALNVSLDHSTNEFVESQLSVSSINTNSFLDFASTP